MTPRPGDFFVTENMSTQWRTQLMAYAIQFGTASHVNHAGIFVGQGQVIEARPGGAGYAPVSDYLKYNTKWSTLPLTDQQREAIVGHTQALIGTPYGWPDIIAIAIAQKRLGSHLDVTKPLAQQPWWYQRIAREDRLICSQLVDYAYYLAGVHLYDDNRPFGLVSPADLEKFCV
jgi:uncharacterized protein YycO